MYWGLSVLSAPIYWGIVGAMALLGVLLCARAGRSLGMHDHPAIVWDEIVAFLIVLPFAPAGLAGAVLAFTLFRLFDIWKPFPIGWLDARVKGGAGVMLDDLVAAFYTVVGLLLLGSLA